MRKSRFGKSDTIEDSARCTVLVQPVLVDGNAITSRFIYDIPHFVDALVAQLI
jgi:protease I